MSKEDRERAEQLNKFFRSVFTVEDTGQVAVPETLSSWKLKQKEVKRDEVLELTAKLKDIKGTILR